MAVEAGLVDQQVITYMLDGGERRRDESTDEAVVVEGLDQQAAARAQDAVKLAKDLLVVVVAEVAEGREPAHDRVERPIRRQVPHVTVPVVDIDTSTHGGLSGDGEE